MRTQPTDDELLVICTLLACAVAGAVVLGLLAIP